MFAILRLEDQSLLSAEEAKQLRQLCVYREESLRILWTGLSIGSFDDWRVAHLLREYVEGAATRVARRVLSSEGERFVEWLRALGALERDAAVPGGFRLVAERNWDDNAEGERCAQVLLMVESTRECVVRLPVFEANRGRLRWTVLPCLLEDGLLLGGERDGGRKGESRTLTRRFHRRNGMMANLKCHTLILARLAELW
jgi:hypothetical protein